MTGILIPWPAFKAQAEGRFSGLEVRVAEEETFGAASEVTSSARGSVIRLETRGGFVASRSAASVARHSAKTVGICLARSGRLRLKMDGQVVVADTGDAILCDSRRAHETEIEPASDGRSEVYILTLTPNGALDHSLSEVSPKSFLFSRADRAGAVFLDFLGRVTKSAAALDAAALRPFEDAAAALLNDLLIANHLARGAEKNPALARVIDEMARRERDPGLRLETIANEVGISARSIQRLFREIDTTPSRWLEERRLSRITAELSSPAYRQRSITQIAQSWGYSDLSHFSKIFKKKYGKAPSDYRRDALAAAASPEPVD